MKSQVKLDIQQNVPLAPMTTFKIGGPAKYFTEVASEEELVEALQYAKKNNLAVFALGGGSNILVSDEGFDGLVIKLKVQSEKLKVAVQSSKILVECQAGDSLANIVKLATENSLTGLEWAVGIPGTIGGAVRGNAGAYGKETKDIIESVRALDLSGNLGDNNAQMQSAKIKMKNCNSKCKIFRSDDCKFGYRSSIFKKNVNLIILSCTLKLQKGEKTEIENKIREIIKKRAGKVPQGQSAGSFFQNPAVGNPELIKKFERDAGCVSCDGKIPAGWFIEKAGLKGKKIGQIQVSEKHANFVVNLGDGRAEDVVALVSLVKQRVRDEFGVELKEEIQYVGF